MAILGKTSITELNLITPLSNANLENSKITINGTDVPLGGSYTMPSAYISKFDTNTHIGTNLVTYLSRQGTETGTIKISLPFKNTSNMLTFEILLYEFKSTLPGASKIIVSAYNYGDGVSWEYATASVIGKYNRDIRFAYDGDKSCILLGNTTDTWAYPQIFVSKLYNGFGVDSNVFKEGYSISFITSESGLSGTVSCSKYLGATNVPWSGITDMKIASANYYGATKILGGDLKNVAYTDGIAAASSHQHSNYALKSDFDASTEVTASALNTINSTLANCASKSDIPGAFTGATASAAGKMGLVPAPAKGDGSKFLKADGSWGTPINTRNTAGSYNHTGKLFLIGATLQTTTSSEGTQTYSNSNVYMQAGKLYANGSEVGTMETINNTVSALTASNVNINDRIRILESRSSLSIAVSTDKTYLLGAASTSATTVNIQTGSTSSENGVWMSNGTITATKGFYQVSDEREKNFKNEIDIDFDKLKSIPKSYFTWKGAEDEKLEIGTSAQKLKEVYPELVSYDTEDDKYTVSYDKLSVVALKAVDKLHEENEMLKEMLIKMEERLSKLEYNK